MMRMNITFPEDVKETLIRRAEEVYWQRWPKKHEIGTDKRSIGKKAQSYLDDEAYAA